MAKCALVAICAIGSGLAQAVLPLEGGKVYTNAPSSSGKATSRQSSLSAGARRLDAANVITQEEKQAILDKHNDLRAAVTQPCTAADMETLVWDDDLELAAASYGQRCLWEHDDANEANDWGENLAFSWSTTGNDYDASTLEGFIQSWYNEVVDTYWTLMNIVSKNYTDPPSQCQAVDTENPSQCLVGHYTQLVWAKSNRIGCSVHQCTDGLLSNLGGVYLVCKYNPAGNSGSPLGGMTLPFILGAPCAFCHESCTSNMCTANTEVERCEDTISIVRFSGKPFYFCEALIGAVGSYCSDYEKDGDEVCRYSCGRCGRPVDLGQDYCGMEPTGELEWSKVSGAFERRPILAILAVLAAVVLDVHDFTR